MTTEIRELISEADLRRAHAVMHELRTDLDEDAYMALLGEMVPQGYRLIALEVDGDISALAGIARRVNFYYRRYIWIYDLVTSEVARSQGYGLQLLRHIEELARAEGCDTVALSSGLQRTDAHRFYLDKANYTKASYSFVKNL